MRGRKKNSSMNGDTAVLNPDYKALEQGLQNRAFVRDEIKNKLQNKTFKTPVRIKREGHSVQDIQKILEYDAIVNYLGMRPFKLNDLKTQWEELKQRPSITGEKYQELLNNQKPKDYEEIKKELNQWHDFFPNQNPQTAKQTAEQGKPEGLENLPSNWQQQLDELKEWKKVFGEKNPQQVFDNQEKHSEADLKPADYDNIKGKLKEWQDAFPNLEVITVKTKYELPATELSEAEKEAIKEYQGVKNERDNLKQKVTDLEARPTKEELNQANGKLKEWTDKFDKETPNEVFKKNQERNDLINAAGGKTIEEITNILKTGQTTEGVASPELQAENEELIKALEYFAERAKRKELELVEPVQNVEQAKMGIEQLLKKTKKSWESHFNGIKELLTLKIAFQYPEKETKAKEVLGLIDGIINSKNYQQLFEKWTGVKYEATNDYDGSLSDFRDYLDFIKNNEKTTI